MPIARIIGETDEEYRERYNEYQRNYRRNNKGKFKIYNIKERERIKIEREQDPVLDRLWKDRHNLEAKRSYYRINKRKRLIEKFGGRCTNPDCLVPGGCTDWRALQVDHKKGHGKKEYDSFKYPYLYYNMIFSLTQEEFDKDYQILCANCNWIKRYECQESSRQEEC